MDRILQVVTGLNRGGLESFVMNVYRKLDRDKIQFDFLMFSKTGVYDDEVLAMGARIFRMPTRRDGYLKSRKAVKDFFKTNARNYIAVHQHVSSLSSLLPMYYAQKYGIPVRILHAHSSSISKAVKGRFIHQVLHFLNKRKVSEYANVYYACSNKAKHWIYDGSGVLDQVIIIKNGIDTRQYAFNKNVREAVRNQMELSDDTIVLGHVGSMIPVKNHMFLLEVFKDFKKLNENSKLLLVGDGGLKNQIREKSEELGISDDVIMLGSRSDVNVLLQGFDFLVMPSLFEGLPVSLVEAQCAGLPVIASDTISSDSKLTDYLFFCPLADGPETWAYNINRILSSFKRKDCSEIVKNNGFDSLDVVNILSHVYRNGHE